MHKQSILITGASGLLGSSLVHEWSGRFNVFATGRQASPGLSCEYKQGELSSPFIDALIEWSNPDIVVHCAALTNVDYCETHKQEAMQVNAEMTKSLAEKSGYRRFIYISSASVLAPSVHMGVETSPVEPRSAYAQAKYQGEVWALERSKNAVVVRTTPVGFSPNGRGFVEWIVGSLMQDTPITLFSDSIFSPIAAHDLALGLEWLFEKRKETVFHIAGREPISKDTFGRMLCRVLRLNESLIKTGLMKESKLIAPRAQDESLSSRRFEAFSGLYSPTLAQTVASLHGDFVKRQNLARKAA